MLLKLKEVDLILFDLDGTLADTHIDIANSVNFMLQKSGFKTKSIKEIMYCVGWGMEPLLKGVLGEENTEIFAQAQFIYEKHYGEHLFDNVKLYPYVKEILAYFANKKKIVISNKPDGFCLKLLKKLSIFSYFEEIIGGDNAKYRKPSPWTINNVLKRLGICKNKAIMVGDMPIDIEAGKRAGILTCGVTYGFVEKEKMTRTHPDFLINKLIELKNILNG